MSGWPPTAAEIRAAIIERERRDDPPECAPDDGEAQRIADTYADAAAELARDEAREA